MGLKDLGEHWNRDYKSSYPHIGFSEVAHEEERKPRYQDIKAAQAWVISSGQTESGFIALPIFVFCRAATNSAAVQSPKISTGVDV